MIRYNGAGPIYDIYVYATGGSPKTDASKSVSGRKSGPGKRKRKVKVEAPTSICNQQPAAGTEGSAVDTIDGYSVDLSWTFLVVD